MPIPLIVWGIAAAAGGYAAWKKRKAIGETISGVMDSIGESAESEVQELESMSFGDAMKYIEGAVPSKGPWQWSAFKRALGKRAHEKHSFYQLLDRAIEIRMESHPEEDQLRM